MSEFNLRVSNGKVVCIKDRKIIPAINAYWRQQYNGNWCLPHVLPLLDNQNIEFNEDIYDRKQWRYLRKIIEKILT